MFIQTQTMLNPSSLMFYLNKPVMEVGSADFPNVYSSLGSPLAKSIYSIAGVVRVFFGLDFSSVTKYDYHGIFSQAATAKYTAINERNSFENGEITPQYTEEQKKKIQIKQLRRKLSSLA